VVLDVQARGITHQPPALPDVPLSRMKLMELV